MQTLNDRKINTLNTILSDLQKELCKPLESVKNVDELLIKIKELETEKKEIEQKKKLSTINNKHDKRKLFLEQVLAIELPTEDITTNLGHLHATKLKKYPSLAEFMKENQYVRFIFKNGNYTECKNGQEITYLKKSTYSDNTTTYADFKDLKEACNYNNIRFDSLNFKKFKALENKILKESERIKAEVKKSIEKLNALDCLFLESENLINKDSYTTYKAYY